MFRVLDMKYNTFFLTLTPVLRRFFHGSGFFQIGSGFLADPDPDPEKKSDPDPGKKTGSENTGTYTRPETTFFDVEDDTGIFANQVPQ